MNKEKLEKIIDAVNIPDLHYRMTKGDSGEKVWVHRDGSLSTVGSGTIPNPNTEENDANFVVAVFPCQGRGNLDEGYFAEGWATQQEDGTYLTDDGRILSADEMIDECLETGDFQNEYESLIDNLRENIADPF